MNYTFYAVAEDREGLYSELKTLNFWTKERFTTAEFAITIKAKAALNSAERQNVTNQLAFVLSLPPTKVIEKYNYDPSETIV